MNNSKSMPAITDVWCLRVLAKFHRDVFTWEIRNPTEWHFNRLSPTSSKTELAWRQWQAPLCLMSLPISRPTAICCWLLPIITRQNNTTLLGTKIKAAVHVCATQLSIKTPLRTDSWDLKETVRKVMNPSRQMRRQYAALQYHNALEIWITTDTTGRSYEVWFHFFFQTSSTFVFSAHLLPHFSITVVIACVDGLKTLFFI